MSYIRERNQANQARGPSVSLGWQFPASTPLCHTCRGEAGDTRKSQSLTPAVFSPSKARVSSPLPTFLFSLPLPSFPFCLSFLHSISVRFLSVCLSPPSFSCHSFPLLSQSLFFSTLSSFPTHSPLFPSLSLPLSDLSQLGSSLYLSASSISPPVSVLFSAHLSGSASFLLPSYCLLFGAPTPTPTPTLPSGG